MKNIILSFILLFSYALLNAQVDRSKMPAAAKAPEIKIGSYNKIELDNGLKVFVVENHKLPVVSVSLFFDYDPVLEKESVGYVSMMGDLLGTGTKTRNKEKLDEEIDFIGASLSTSSNGVYGRSLKKYSDKLFDLISDVVLNPAFDSTELEKLRRQTLSGLQASKTQPSYIAGNLMSRVIFSNKHPYGEFQTEESVKKVTLDQCIKHYKTVFRPNICYMTVVGDITLAEATALVKKYFSKWQDQYVPRQYYPEPKLPGGIKICVVDRPEAVQTTLHIAYPVNLKPGQPDGISAQVMNTILGGGSFRLFDNLREKYGFTYGAYSSLSPDPLAGYFDAEADVRTSVTDSAVNQFFFEMNRIRTEPVSTEELTRAKNYFNGGFALSLEDPRTIARFAVNIERYKLPKDYYDTYMARVQALTPEDIRKAALKYIHTDSCYVFAVGNVAEFADKLKEIATDKKLVYYDLNIKEYDPLTVCRPAPAGMTAEKVLENYITAIGGKAAMTKVKSIETRANIDFQGNKLVLVTKQMAPNKYLSVLANAQMTLQKQVFDGTKGKMYAMGNATELTGADLEELKYEATMMKELKYAELGVKLKLMGIEKVDGKDAYKIELILPSGEKQYEYYDVSSALQVKSLQYIEGPKGKIERTAIYSDYREIGGLKYPFSIVQEIGPQKFEMKVESITINKIKKAEVFNVDQP